MRRALLVLIVLLLGGVSIVYAQGAVVSDGVRTIGADEVHDRGITGDGIRVGIVGSGFNTSNPEIADNIAGSRGFGTTVAGNNTPHGTAVAEIVVDTAPNASLYVASFDTVSDYESAVQWLVQEKNVDVLATSVGFTGEPHDGTGETSVALADAVDNGTVVVSSVGNLARKHWEGTFDGGTNHSWVTGDVTNYLDPDAETDAIESITDGTRIEVTLTWDDWPETGANYDLYLHYGNGTIAESSTVTQDGNDPPRETVEFTAPASAQYYIRVAQVSAATDHTIEVFSTTHALEHRVVTSSVTAPATGQGVIGVGAYDPDVTSVRPYSARGPADDGSQGVDILAPDYVNVTAEVGDCTSSPCTVSGTSFAQPHVAGTVALMLAKNPFLTPREVRSTLYATANAISGDVNATGNGTVDAADAVSSVPYATVADVPEISVTGDVTTSNVTYHPWAVNGRYVAVTITPNASTNVTITLSSVNRSVTYFQLREDGSLDGVALVNASNVSTYTDHVTERTTYVFRGVSRTANTLCLDETVRYRADGRLDWIENRSAFVTCLANGTTTDAVYLRPTTGTVTYRVGHVSTGDSDVLGATVVELTARKEAGRVTFRFSGLTPNRSYSLVEDGRTAGVDRASPAGVVVFERAGAWSTNHYRVVVGPYALGGFEGVPRYVFPIALGIVAVGVVLFAQWRYRRSRGSPEWVR